MTPIPKPTSSHQKGVKMKSTPTQPKKKIAMTKAVNDSISDTISSVIQGKSTHQKPASPKKLVKNDKPKVIKKLCTRKAPSSSIPTPKNDNANVTRAYNAKVEASSPKKQQEKPVKAVKQLKPNLSPDVKSQIKPTNVVKRQISPVKVVTAIADKDKPTTNVSKERTSNKVSEKKEKSAPAKNKTIAANKTTKMEKNKVLADQKLIKQNLVTKPKKVVQNNKSGVKKKILKSKPVALPKKIIKTITQKRKLPVKDVKDDTSNPPKLATPTNCTVTSPSSTSIDKVSTASNSVLKEEVIKKEPLDEPNSAKLVKVKEERDSDSENKLRKVKPLPKVKSKPNSMMIKRLLGNQSVKNKKQSKKMKLYNMWNGPKRHRVASLNALAKVHCLYENESRSILIDQIIDGVKKENTTKIKSEDEAPCSSTRQLRTAPGLRGVGKHWEMHESSSSSSRSSSSSEEDEYEFKETIEKPCLRKIRRIRDNYKVKEKIGESNKDSNDETETVAPTKAKRPRKPKKKPDSPIMDLKDLIVPKRMASLNASAILAASYSVEKRSNRPPNSDSEDSTDSGDSYFKEPIPEDEQLEQIVKMEQEQACADERAKHMVQAPPNSKKVAVILNQDTDVTITGVYVNSTRSTHHEGFCSIAGMQYRISATSHTQTAATAVTSETILQSASSGEHSTTNGDSTSTSTGPVPTQQPNKSYTPLDALSSMQPPSGSTSSSSANLQQAPSTSGPQPQQQQPLINPHHNHHHSHNRQHISSPPGGPHTLHPLHQPQQQQYHHHHHHLSGPPPGHYHHPHQLVVAQYPPQQYYPHPGTIAHGGKSRYGLYHHHHHPSGDRGTYSNSSDNSAFSVPPGGLFPNSTSAGVASTVSSSSSVVAANSGGGQPPPPTASQSSAGSGSESEIGSSSGYVHGE